MTTKRIRLAAVALFAASAAYLAVSGAYSQTSGPKATASAYTVENPERIPSGELRLVDDLGRVQAFPLKHTDVRAEIVGNVARVEVTQSFENPYDRKIEAVYVFPLPNRAAVDDMQIRVGERTIKGVIKRREEARRIYENARRAGHVAALLDQERPNIFTQSVTNILPGNAVEVKIRYFEALAYGQGEYTFTFPMVVGPRFIPGTPTSEGERGWASNTAAVPDASRITPPVLRPGQRSGHDISLTAKLEAGTELSELFSPSHQVEVEHSGASRAKISLAESDTIPNKDFVLRYRLDGNDPRVVFLPHRKAGDGYFLLLIQPEARPAPEKIAPKEMVFVVDGSGSMSGFPMEKVKEAMRHALRNLNAGDTFQIVRFSNGAETFAPAPVPATPSNVERGLSYVESLSGRGGTIMLEGVRAALEPPKDPERLRIVSFMTDGYIGNEDQILAFLERNLGGARLFSFGVGSSVNRYLLDKMAELGRGAVAYVLPSDDAEEPVKRFYDRIRNPYLTDLQIDWNELPITDVYPKRIPDVFLGQPVVVFGRYMQPGDGSILLRGRLGGRPYEQRIALELPRERDEGEAIATLWARARIEDLSNLQIVDPRPETVEAITRVALAHRLVSAHTSFVAVEERIVTGSDEPALVEVPVEMPAGVSYEGVFGDQEEEVEALGRARVAPYVVGNRVDSVGRRGASPAVVAPEPRRSAPGEWRLREADELQKTEGTLVCRIAAERRSYRLGETIEILLTLESASGRSARVPAGLSVADGTLRFQIMDTSWNLLPHPERQVAEPKTVELPPGGRLTLRIVLNGPGGYRMAEPGTYHVVLLGKELGLPAANGLTLHILP